MSTFHENLVQSFKNFRDKFLKASDGLIFKFTKDSTTGKYGYQDANGNFIPFKTAHTATKSITAGTSTGTTDMGEDHEYRYVSVAPTPSQTKSVTATTSTQTVSPDSGKLLSSVTVNPQSHTGTYTPTSRSASLDMGINNNYRYVNTNSVPNTNSTTYSVTSNGTKDMGATNTYRYVSVSVKPIEVGFVILKLANYNHEFYFNLSTGAKANSDAYNTTGISSANMQYRVYQQVFGTDYAQIIAKTAGLYWDNISNTTRQLSAGTTILSIKNTTNNSMSIGIAVKLT